jgi:hypothetical protein
MISSVTASQIQPEAVTNTQPRQAAPHSTAAPAEQDSVQLSSAAQTALAAYQAKPAEATETVTQTFNEAAHGDLKALAKLDSNHSSH